MAETHNFSALALFLFLLLILFKLNFCVSKPSGFSLKLIPRDSLESPLYPGNLTQLERVKRLTKFSKTKAKHAMLSLVSPNATLGPQFITGMMRQSFYFMTEVALGTPPVHVLLLVDTGAGLIWTQCEPCINCYPLTYPIFNSQVSFTYRKLPCYHPLCQGPGNLYNCVDGDCVFSEVYGGGSAGPAKGVVSMEKFIFGYDAQGHEISRDLIFGCAYDNQNFQAFGSVISGILGLNFAQVSLSTQLLDWVDHRFSYCMPPYPDTAISFLRFGSDIPKVPDYVKTIRMYTWPDTIYILLPLQDISVGFRRLNFPPGTFVRIRGGSTVGITIDSGAPFTILDTNSNGINAYRVVADAFQSHFDSLHLGRVAEAQETLGLNLCYRFRPGFSEFPSLTYHFENADYVLDGIYVVLFADRDIFCLPMVPGQGISIIGAMHQQNMRLIYDIYDKTLQFYRENCADDR